MSPLSGLKPVRRMRVLLADAPAVSVVLVVLVLALVILPLAHRLSPADGALHGLEPFLELMAVLLGLLVVSVSLHALEAHEQARANVLVTGFGVAAACNFMHGVLNHSEGSLPAGSAEISLWLGDWARLAEAATLWLTALRLPAPGPARAWLVAAGAITLAIVLTAMGPLPPWFDQAAGGALHQALAAALVLALCLAALLLWRNARRHDKPGERLFAWAALIFVGAECTAAAFGRHSALGGALAHGLRVVGYALLYQAIFDSAIRRPFARIQEAESRLRESESRLSLLGQNLPHSVLFQSVREKDGSTRFAHMGAAIERLNGVHAADVLRDPGLAYRQILEPDRELLRQAARRSLRTMSSMELVYRLRHGDGQLRWMHLSASPRALPGARVIWDGVQTDITAHHLAEQAAHAHQALLANMLRQVPGGVARLDHSLRILYVNEQQARWWGRPAQQLQGQRLQDLLAPQALALMAPHLEQAFAGRSAVFESQGEGPQGPSCQHITLAPETVGGGHIPAVVLFAYDLSALKRAEQELAHQKAHLARVVSAMPDMVFLKDASGVYLSVNPVFERFIGRPERQIVGRTDYDLTTPALASRFREYDQRALQAWQPLVYEETLTFADDGYQGQFETIKTPIRDLHGRVTGVLGVCRDITDRKRVAQEIERLAFYDALTGLPNRRLLLDRLQRAIASGLRSNGLAALLFIDLDNFKDLNDTLGHDMGDRLLAQVAARLVAGVREADTVARFGGDEFVVMLEALAPDLPGASAQAETVAGKLLASLNLPFDLGGQQYYSTPSMGVTLFGDERLAVDELLKRADLAMYQAKAAGRNTLRFFNPAMQAAVNARSNLEAELRQGLARGELLVHYQPVVDHQTLLTGAEALVRWQHPRRGLIGPGEFIPLAEQTGLIFPLGQYVLQTACAQLRRWSERPETAALSISVNVSARQFRQPGFVAQVLQTLQNHGARAQQLKLELTESLLLGDTEDTIARMVQLKSEGVGFALDDFGTGYSSLGYLKRLPLDQIKIDQSFVRDMLVDANDAVIVRTILALAKSLDLQVVAEGVESAGQLAFLRLHGCEGFQGHLFGHPAAIDLFERAQGLVPTQPPVSESPATSQSQA